MSTYINPIPNFEKHITEAESFLQRLTDNRFAAEQWSLLWKNLNIVRIRLVKLQGKWKGYKKSTGITPKKVIKKDISSLVHRLGIDILESESAIEWGIRSTQSLIDKFPSLLPYLMRTDFSSYIEEIGSLLAAVIMKTKHGEVMKLLRELKEHPDMIAIGQFATNEMVDYYKHLIDDKLPNTRKEIIKYIDIYRKLCGIYEKDMILCYCLLQLKLTGFRPTYVEAHPESRHLQDRNNFVKRRISLFGKVYDLALRNADAHTSIETDSNKHMVTIYTGRGEQSKSYTYEQIISVTRGMSALVLAFRLLVIILGNHDWRAIKSLLK